MGVAIEQRELGLVAIAKRLSVIAVVGWAVTGLSLLIDDPAERLVHDIGQSTATGVVARFGSWEYLLPLVVISGAVLLFLQRRLFAAGFVVLSYVLAALATGTLKTALARPEPLDVAGDLGRSFPSGHGAQAVAVYGALVVVLMVYRNRYAVLARNCAIGIVGLVVLALYIRDAHWLSDFFGGIAIGFTALAISAWLWNTANTVTHKP